MFETGFPCSADKNARVLILGSMPSRKSLLESQYYAHPQNGFWPIMGQLFGFDAAMDYKQRLEQLRRNGVALWDVAHQCDRPGSMDSAIDTESVIANDFNAFFAAHQDIRVIFFNGRKAEELFRRLVLPGLPEVFQQIRRQWLPSTSPAHAAMSMPEKYEKWQIIRQALESA